MAEWYDEQYGEYYEEIPTADATEQIHSLLFGADYEVDQHALSLFEAAVFDDDNRSYRELIDYMWDEYGIDFEDAYSWEDFREWYGSQ